MSDSPFDAGARARRLAVAIVSMFAGCGLVLWTVIVMNAHETAPEEDDDGGKQIVVQPPERKPPPKKKKKPPPRRRRRATDAKRAPLPNLSTSISGSSFGIPQLEGLNLDEAADQVLGDEAVREMVMNANTVDEQPRVVARGSVGYPPRARQKNIEGYVKLSFIINERGEVEKLAVIESDPPGVFEETAIAAVGSTRYSPARYRGQPVRFRATQKVPFRLE